MIKLLHELKRAFFDMEALMNLIMSQQGKRKTKLLLDFQARNQLGTPRGGEEFSKWGTNFLNYVQ